METSQALFLAYCEQQRAGCWKGRKFPDSSQILPHSCGESLAEFSPQRQDKIWKGPGNKDNLYILYSQKFFAVNEEGFADLKFAVQNYSTRLALQYYVTRIIQSH